MAETVLCNAAQRSSDLAALVVSTRSRGVRPNPPGGQRKGDPGVSVWGSGGAERKEADQAR